MNLTVLLGKLFKNGIRIGWSSGKPFDPTDQIRTDPMKDIIEAEEKRKKTKKRRG